MTDFTKKYKDTEQGDLFKELDQNLEKIQLMSTDRVMEYLFLFFPDWIVEQTQKYAKEYETLEQNWHRLCAQWKTVPRAILIVEYLPQPEQYADYQLLLAFCNHLTRMGYVIRQRTDLQRCPNCGCAILSRFVHGFLKQRGSKMIPAVWSSYCIDCKSAEA
jgi:hypothetical protein